MDKAKIVGRAINALSYLSEKQAGKIAYHLFSTPRDGRNFKKGETNILNEAEKDFIDSDGVPIAIYKWGVNGQKTVLLLHGWDSHSGRWYLLIPLLLRANINVIAMDNRAHGFSGGKRSDGMKFKNALTKVMAKFNPDYAIGHSFGGMALAHYLSKHPSNSLKKTILMGTPIDLFSLLDRFFELLGLNKRVLEGMNIHFIETYNFEISYYNVEKFLSECNPCDGLIIHDEGDDVIPANHAEKMQKAWKGSHLFITKKLGHSLQGRNVYRRILEEIE